MRIRDRVHTDTLPPSYYTDVARDKAPFDRLEGSQKADILIVGGGYTGVSAALMLAEKGYSVALLEQNQIGWGASGRNGGQLLGGYGPEQSDIAKMERIFGKDNVDTAWDLGVESVCLVRECIHKYGIECDLKWGYMDAAMKKRELRSLKEDIDTLLERGYPHHLYAVEKDDLASVIGSKRYVGGVVNTGYGHVQPLDLVRGEARAAQKLGAKIYEDARVSELKYGDKVTAITDSGAVEADIALLAGNAYLGGLNKRLERIISRVGSYIISTEPLEAELQAKLMPADFAICDQRTALDYFRMSADGRLLFGGLATYTGRHPSDIAAKLRPKMLKVFPELKGVKISHAWGGYIGVSLNRTPQLGRLANNVYYAQAYSGHGLAPSHMSAKLVCEAIDGQLSRFDVVAKVKHIGLPGGMFVKQPLLALGMLWYRMKDFLPL